MGVSDAPAVEEIWPRYFLRIAYDGTRYHGWQRQPNGHSVQAELESALRKLLRQERVITTGCGRTDAGVHATCFYLHFNALHPIEDPEDLIYRLNQVLPSDIAAYEVSRVHDRAHARFDAVSRSYAYHVHTRPDPFLVGRSMRCFRLPDESAMNEAAVFLLGKQDFASFCKSGGAQKTTICEVREAGWSSDDHQLVFTITADRFLRNMVRAVVGTLLDVGWGKLRPEALRSILEGRERRLAGESVDACGLFLTSVAYPDSVFVP